MRMSDWSSDVCSSDLGSHTGHGFHASECADLSWVHMPAPGRQVHLLQMGGCGFRRFRPRYRRCLHQAGTPCRTSNALFDWKEPAIDRKSVVGGKGVSVRVDIGVRRFNKTKNNKKEK